MEPADYLCNLIVCGTQGFDYDAEAIKRIKNGIAEERRMAATSRSMAASIAKARASTHGLLIMDALGSLAVSSGKSIGTLQQNEKSLGWLLRLLRKIDWDSLGISSDWLGWFQVNYEMLPGPLSKEEFQEIERILTDHPLHNRKFQHPIVGLLVSVAKNPEAYQLVSAARTRIRMATRIKRLVSPSQTAIQSTDLAPPPPRRRSMGI